MGIVTLMFALTAALYAASCGLFFAHLVRGGPKSVRWASNLLGAGIALHVGFLGSDYAIAGHSPTSDIYQALALLSLLIALSYLLTMRRHRLTVLGAFITPVTLLMFLAVGLRDSVPQVPEDVRSALLPVHVGGNVLGIVAFALAFAAAVGYVIQERLLRSKHVIGVFQRLPPLDVLDSLGLRLVTIGFPLFTVGLITGTLWAARRGSSIDTAEGLGLVAWLFFGSVLLARAAAGWRGRRAAIGTMIGFLFSMAALAGYVLRGFGGS